MKSSKKNIYLEIINLKKIYPPNIIAVNDVSFNLAKGEIATLIGTSGCGKTTILHMINRLIEPTSGEIRMSGRPISSLNLHNLRKSMGLVIQNGGLFPHLTVEENIVLGEYEKGKKKNKKRANELLDLVHLEPKQFASRYPKHLSGGQLQRVGIARALMADPPILLMDEPFGALDPITRSSLHKEFWELNQRLGKTIIIVTHDLIEAFKLSDHIFLMNKGTIVQKGTRLDDFVKRPSNPFVKDFIKSQTADLIKDIP